MISGSLKLQVEALLQTSVSNFQPIGGGSISEGYQMRGDDGKKYFLKVNHFPDGFAMLRSEQLGLALLGASRVIAVPKVLGLGQPENQTAFLILEWVESGFKNPLFWEKFGAALANLHGNISEWFGFSHDNFIGSLSQSNRRHDSWEDFYTNERLLPQMITAVDLGRLTQRDGNLLENLCRKISFLCPEAPPSLCHGDLWSGNFLCNTVGEPVLIDPAAAFMHREMDLAMSRLFGGFHTRFYESYEANWELDPGFEKRLEIYQLYYLLVHVNLFGGNYIPQVRTILERFG